MANNWSNAHHNVPSKNNWRCIKKGGVLAISLLKISNDKSKETFFQFLGLLAVIALQTPRYVADNCISSRPIAWFGVRSSFCSFVLSLLSASIRREWRYDFGGINSALSSLRVREIRRDFISARSISCCQMCRAGPSITIRLLRFKGTQMRGLYDL